jgi:hypothetical protein
MNMTKLNKPIRNITALEREIYRLELEARKMEDKMGDNYQYLKSHFPGLLIGSVIQHSAGKSIKYTILDSIWKNEKVQESMHTVAENITERVAAWVKRKFGGK